MNFAANSLLDEAAVDLFDKHGVDRVMVRSQLLAKPATAFVRFVTVAT